MESEHRNHNVPPKTVVVNAQPTVVVLRLLNGSQHTLATPGARLGARIIDFFVPLLAGLVILWGLTDIRLVVPLPELGRIIFIVIVAAFLLLAYEPVFIALKGQTVGKMWLGIKVVSIEDGSVPGWEKGVKRWIVPFLLQIIPFLTLIGYLALLWNKNRQTWWDKIAGTVVIQTNRTCR